MVDVPIALQFVSVSFSYPALDVLEDVSFHFHSGEFIALVGPNGSGKTTLLKLILGLEQPQKGAINVLKTTEEIYSNSPADVEAIKSSSFGAYFSQSVAKIG
ncbi:MAG: ATP-binding cassette domain-containing protein, partial [Sphaerochaeta sp.]|nr:ATP-binding cassette domain-containing protein [Sphaerochaeta sp.]